MRAKKTFQKILAIQRPWSGILWMHRSTYLEGLFLKIVKEGGIKLRSDGSYIDLGCGDERSVNNILTFSKHFSESYYLDVTFVRGITKRLKEGVTGSLGITSDVQQLPFRDETFDAVSAFSLIEHLPRRDDFLREVSRVLKKGGIFILQFPNRDFFIELHNGMFFPGIIPRRYHFWFIKAAYSDFSDSTLNLTNFPMNPNKKDAIKKCKKFFHEILVEKVNYPENLMPEKLSIIYTFLRKLGILNLVPMGYLFVCIK